MRIIEVTVTLSRKANLENMLGPAQKYENMEHFISAKAQLMDGTLKDSVRCTAVLNRHCIRGWMSGWRA